MSRCCQMSDGQIDFLVLTGTGRKANVERVKWNSRGSPSGLAGGYVIRPPESTAAVAGGTVGAVELNGQRPDTLHPEDTSLGPIMSSACCSRLLGQSDCCVRRSPLRNFLHNIRPKLGANRCLCHRPRGTQFGSCIPLPLVSI